MSENLTQLRAGYAAEIVSCNKVTTYSQNINGIIDTFKANPVTADTVNAATTGLDSQANLVNGDSFDSLPDTVKASLLDTISQVKADIVQIGSIEGV
jgi:hypothetical protein